jgi:hypothetical protein
MSEPNISAVPASHTRMTVKTVTSLGMLTAVAYLAMACAILAFFTGNGEFIYEGF